MSLQRSQALARSRSTLPAARPGQLVRPAPARVLTLTRATGDKDPKLGTDGNGAKLESALEDLKKAGYDSNKVSGFGIKALPHARALVDGRS